jgi:hypothetical protein
LVTLFLICVVPTAKLYVDRVIAALLETRTVVMGPRVRPEGSVAVGLYLPASVVPKTGVLKVASNGPLGPGPNTGGGVDTTDTCVVARGGREG